MSFWKLVAAIVLGNLLTGVAALILWSLLLAGIFGSLGSGPPGGGYGEGASSGRQPDPIVTNSEALEPVTNALPYDAFDNVTDDGR